MAANDTLPADLLINNMQRYIPLTAEEKNYIQELCIIKHLPRGHHLLEEGMVCRYDAFVLSGSLKGYVVNGDSGKEEIVLLAVADWWACDLESFQAQTPSSLFITAVTPATVALISRPAFDELLEKIPRLEKYFRIILQKHAVALQRRLYYRNTHDAKSRYHTFLEQYPALHEQLPQYLIASYLGISAEMLSKIRAQKEG